MDATIGRENIKAFGKALTCLSRIGPVVRFEWNTSGLVCRTLSTSQSAYAHFYFPITYFNHIHIHDETKRKQVEEYNQKHYHDIQEYQQQSIQHHYHQQQQAARDGVQPGAAVQQQTAPTPPRLHPLFIVKCRLTLRALLHVFKNYTSAAYLEISLNSVTDTATFSMLDDDTRMKRIYRFNFEENPNVLQADFTRKQCTTHMSCQPKTLAQCLSNFNNHVDEMTLHFVSADKLILANHVGTRPDELTKMPLETEYQIHRREFIDYTVGDKCLGSKVTFCSKELRSMLALCESIDQPIHIFVDRASRPILLTNAMASIDKNQVHHQLMQRQRHRNGSSNEHEIENENKPAAYGLPGAPVDSQLDIILATLQEEQTAQTQAQNTQQTQPQHRTSAQPQPPSQVQQHHQHHHHDESMDNLHQNQHTHIFHEEEKIESHFSDRSSEPLINVFSKLS